MIEKKIMLLTFVMKEFVESFWLECVPMVSDAIELNWKFVPHLLAVPVRYVR